VANRLKADQRQQAHAGLVRIYSAPNRRQALLAFRDSYRHWHPLDPEAADYLKRDLDQLFTIPSVALRAGLFAVFHYANQRWPQSLLKEFAHKTSLQGGVNPLGSEFVEQSCLRVRVTHWVAIRAPAPYS